MKIIRIFLERFHFFKFKTFFFLLHLKKPEFIDLEWEKREFLFYDFLVKWKSDKKKPTKISNNIGIVITPWVQTAVPWFSITIGLFLMNRGNKVSLIIDDLGNGIEEHQYFIFQLNSIKKNLHFLPRNIRIIELSKIIQDQDSTDNVDKYFIDVISTLNGIHFFKGETIEFAREEFHSNVRMKLMSKYPKIDTLLKKYNFATLLVPGGIWGSSALFLNLATLKKIRVSTYDAGFGSLLISTNGIAAHLTDIPSVFNALEDKYLNYIIDRSRIELEKRKNAIDNQSNLSQSIQIIPYHCDEYSGNVGILLLLNLVSDTAALGLTSVFTSTIEWIIESITWVLENSNEVITVRQHPIERQIHGRSNDDYLSLISSHFGTNNRVKFISADDNVNTYKLIENAKIIITHSSTTAIEAVILEKVVMTITNCYYSDLGFVLHPKNKDEYFSYINDAICQKVSISAEQIKNAAKCYYLSQCCNKINTIFTPQPSDFYKWVSMDPMEIFEFKEVNDILDAIEKGIPISLIRHKYMTTHIPKKFIN